MKKIEGTDECFACGRSFNWGYIPSARNGQIITYIAPDVRAI